MARVPWREVFSQCHQKARELRLRNVPAQQFARDDERPLRGWKVDCYIGDVKRKDEYRGTGSYTDIWGTKFLVLGVNGMLYEYVQVTTDESGTVTEQRNAYKVEPHFRIRIFGKDAYDTTNQIMAGLNKL